MMFVFHCQLLIYGPSHVTIFNEGIMQLSVNIVSAITVLITMKLK